MGGIIPRKLLLIFIIFAGTIATVLLLLNLSLIFSKPYLNERKKIESVVKDTSNFPSTANLVPGFERRQGELSDLAKQIDEDLKNGKVSDAQVKLLEFKTRVKQLGGIMKETIIPIEVQKQHDPEGKYLKTLIDTRVDPKILPYYLKTIDLLVAFDKKNIK